MSGGDCPSEGAPGSYGAGVPGPPTSREDFQQRVDRGVLVLFATVVESLAWATAALLDQDVERADRLIAEDRQVDQRCRDLTGIIKERLAEESVEPDELEDLISVLQMIPELERSADLAEHIAQRARQDLGGSITPRSRGLIQSMCDVGVRMWQMAGRGYAERARDISVQLADADDELDVLSAHLLGEGAGEGAPPSVAAELALVARFYERLGDHAVNLARRVDTMAAPKRLSSLRSWARHPGGNRPAGRRRAGKGGAGLDAARAALRDLLWPRPPREESEFFELFASAAANGRACAEELRKMIASFTDLEAHYEEIRGLERRGDQITVGALRRLDAGARTPYDREDIHALIEELDDVVDEMFAAAELINLVRVERPLPEVVDLADILAAMAAEMEGLIACLRHRQGARQRLERIESLERDGDAAFRRCIARLFSGEYEPLEVIKWKDIVQALENSVNRIEGASKVVETILVKNPGA